MKTHDVKKQIQIVLAQEPLLKGAHIDVVVKVDAIILKGFVDHFAKKAVATNLVHGMNLHIYVTDHLDVVLGNNQLSSDDEIASVISTALEKNLGDASTSVTTIVNNGFIEIIGHVKWHYQKQLAAECISEIKGIKGIINNIIASSISDEIILRKNIISALKMVCPDEIMVEVADNNVILNGNVTNHYLIDDIEKIIKKIPGVNTVQNHLTTK